MNFLFMFILLSAAASPFQLTESYAFFMSCRIIHVWPLFSSLVCSSICLKVTMEPYVDVPFSTEQLFPFSMLWHLQASSILLVCIFVNIFLKVSSRVIGLVFAMFFPQSFGFAIGIMLARLQSLGILSVIWI